MSWISETPRSPASSPCADVGKARSTTNPRLTIDTVISFMTPAVSLRRPRHHRGRDERAPALHCATDRRTAPTPAPGAVQATLTGDGGADGSDHEFPDRARDDADGAGHGPRRHRLRDRFGDWQLPAAPAHDGARPDQRDDV